MNLRVLPVCTRSFIHPPPRLHGHAGDGARAGMLGGKFDDGRRFEDGEAADCNLDGWASTQVAPRAEPSALILLRCTLNVSRSTRCSSSL